jgi:hypothetical protein
MKQNQVFRPKGNLGWAGVAFVLNALFLTQALAYPSEGSILLLDLTASATVAFVVYIFWVRPKLILKETSLVVVNPIRRTEINYHDITSLDTKWALLVHHSNTKTRVWVAPANGRQRWVSDSVQRWTVGKFLQKEKTDSEFTSISQSTSSDSGLAYQLISERIKGLH